MKVWALTEEFSEGKYLVVRRDGTTPAWPHFVIGANDPCAYYALMAYAKRAAMESLDPEFVSSVRELAEVFSKWKVDHQFDHKPGDPDAGPHRKDNPTVLAMMRRETDVATLITEHQALAVPDHPSNEQMIAELSAAAIAYGDACVKHGSAWLPVPQPILNRLTQAARDYSAQAQGGAE